MLNACRGAGRGPDVCTRVRALRPSSATSTTSQRASTPPASRQRRSPSSRRRTPRSCPRHAGRCSIKGSAAATTPRRCVTRPVASCDVVPCAAIGTPTPSTPRDRTRSWHRCSKVATTSRRARRSRASVSSRRRSRNSRTTATRRGCWRSVARRSPQSPSWRTATTTRTGPSGTSADSADDRRRVAPRRGTPSRRLRRHRRAARLQPLMPIVGLAEEATARRPDLADAVFDAADQPGRHRDYLRRRRQERVGDQTSQRPALRLLTTTDDETPD